MVCCSFARLRTHSDHCSFRHRRYALNTQPVLKHCMITQPQKLTNKCAWFLAHFLLCAELGLDSPDLAVELALGVVLSHQTRSDGSL